MNLASLGNGRPDGQLVVVSADHSRFVSAGRVAPSLLAALDDWHATAPQLADLFGALNRLGKSLETSPVSPAQAAELLALVGDGTISGTIAKQVFEKMLESGDGAALIVEREGLKQTSDTGAIEAAVAKVLADRPVLIMTVTGMARLDVEREGYKRERLQALVVAEQRRAQGGGTATVTVSPAQYPELLKAVYRRADITKPRNLVGLAKDLPVPEMEALLLADIPVTEESMRELALQRGVAVRDYLATRQLPLERLFLGAPKTTADKAPATAGAATAASGAASGPTEAAWTPRAELALTIK